jgi:hypothetical protein
MNRTTKRAAAAPPTQDDADRRLAEGLDRLDFARAEGLRRGAGIQATQAAGATRERDRLAAKYGADHPRVRAAGARVAAETRLATAVAAHAEQASAPAPKVDEGTWVVQGRVLCADGRPAPDLTVSLFFQSEGWDGAPGYVCTDPNGFFALAVKPQDTQPRELVVSQKGTVLHRDPRVLTPAADTLDTRLVVLDAKSGACPPPDFTDGKVGGTTLLPGPGGGGTGGGTGGGGGAKANVWSVRGKVTDADGKPAAGLTVSLFDQDLFFDDRLGQTTTNAAGEYLFTYRTRDFRDVIERRPDLYVAVLDEKGSTLHRARTKVKPEAGREEVIDIRLPRPKRG